MSRIRLLLGMAVAVLSAVRLARADPPKITFDDITLPEIAATFVSPVCRAAVPPPREDNLLSSKKPINFVLNFDPDPTASRLMPNGIVFRYVFYIEDRSVAPSAWYVCPTKVTPNGRFVDKNVDVHFHINGTETGTITIPLHSTVVGNDLLSVSKPSGPLPIDLSDAQPLDIKLASVVSDFPVVVKRSITVTPKHRAYWDSWEKTALPSDIAVTPAGTTVKIPIVHIHRVEALLATLTSLKPDASHDTLTVALPYHSDGGVDLTKSIDVEVRFAPSLLSLIVALLVGSIVGTLAGQLLPGAWKGWRYTLRTGGRALFYSAVAEAAALFLHAKESKFVLFGAELDPLQCLSVFFIGFLTSGGKAVVQFIRPEHETPRNESTTADRHTEGVIT